MLPRISVDRAETAFVSAAQGAAEILRQVFKLRAGTEITFGETNFFIVDPAAEITYMLHIKYLVSESFILHFIYTLQNDE